MATKKNKKHVKSEKPKKKHTKKVIEELNDEFSTPFEPDESRGWEGCDEQFRPMPPFCQFNVGDVVELNSGGQQMTVKDVSDPDNIECVYFTQTSYAYDVLSREFFDSRMLKCCEPFSSW